MRIKVYFMVYNRTLGPRIDDLDTLDKLFSYLEKEFEDYGGDQEKADIFETLSSGGGYVLTAYSAHGFQDVVILHEDS